MIGGVFGFLYEELFYLIDLGRLVKRGSTFGPWFQIWDYSNIPLNINGRTTLPFMVFWGLGGMVLMKLVYPFVSKWIEKIPYKIGQAVFYIALVLMAVDLVLSYGAMGRRAMRDQGVPPQTFIGKFFNRVYPDEYIDEKIPVMVFKQKE